MNLEYLYDDKVGAMGLDECFQTAVCVALVESIEGPAVLLEKRSSTISDQPGDICLPGGAIEPGETAAQAAVRECSEELLLPEEEIRLLGALDFLHMERLVVYPFAAELSSYGGSFSEAEVAEVFTVPISWLQENPPEEYTIDWKPLPPKDFPFERITGGRSYKWLNRSEKTLFYQYGEHTIWGLTARILQHFANVAIRAV